MKPLVSTITPCFRMGKYLPLFLEWLPKQTYFDRLQVVLDHNEPTLDEIQLVRAFQKKYPGRLKHIVVKKVDPIGTSMNRCIQEADGEYLTIWNVDDLRTPESIQLQAEYLQQHPEVGVVHGDFLIVPGFGKTAGPRVEVAKFPEEELVRGMVIGPYFMFRKELVKKAGLFDEQLRQGADFDLAIRLALHAKVGIVDGLLGYYLDEGKGQSTKPGSLLPVEQDVIFLRYHILDRIDPDHLGRALTYDIAGIHVGKQRYPATSFIPEYNRFLQLQQQRWMKPEQRASALRKTQFERRTGALLYRLHLFMPIKRLKQRFGK